MGKPVRKLLKYDAALTIFDHIKINDHLNEEQALAASNPPRRFSYVKMRLSITENAKNLNKN